MQPYPQSTSNATRFTETGIIAFVLDDLLTLLVNNRLASQFRWQFGWINLRFLRYFQACDFCLPNCKAPESGASEISPCANSTFLCFAVLPYQCRGQDWPNNQRPGCTGSIFQFRNKSEWRVLNLSKFDLYLVFFADWDWKNQCQLCNNPHPAGCS